ncbi:dihydropteroate synthase [Thiomicrorhabdus immobilis]|uniref:Dihydropteroate synthase n=1 Tax=Thiomicrorhabdus immobilis TaxID=2791037 RepID=A0ABN6CX87_9GAMM|nr:dihydropteroate synthase [Thiomicrorhabdus immobilis]BCN93721.1 dihydropteroate synthase [Thiomicrorhabdus immobilis]
MFDIEKELHRIHLTRPGTPLVMGILNVTPDSFSDGGLFVSQKLIEERVVQMISQGVDIIDVGGESTRPGADAVPLSVELERVIPVVEWITERFDVPVSVDTYKTPVMQESIIAGVSIVNDVNALQDTGAIDCVAKGQVAVCLMHKKGNPGDMQQAPSYEDVVEEVKAFLLSRASVCEQAGIDKSRIILDPGFGFGKTLEHNKRLFKELSEFTSLEYPILVGVSRKRMIGEILGDVPLQSRLHGSVAAAILAGMKGSQIVRVHDVAPTVEALTVIASLT